MKKYSKWQNGNSPDSLKRLGSMNAFLMPEVGSLNDSGFSVELSEDEINDVMELFIGLEGLDEEDD